MSEQVEIKMKKINLLFLISDEGFGHTVRQSCIANELIKKNMKVTFQFRDPIPFAQKILNKKIDIHNCFNLIRIKKQRGKVDIEQTHKFFKNYILKSNEWINTMLKSPHVKNSDIIITDLVEEVGILTEKLNKPTIAISHFTWHWYLHYLSKKFDDISHYLENCLDSITGFLYTPFSKNPEQFPNSTPINLIARKPRNKNSIRKELNLSESSCLITFAGGGTTVWKGLIELFDIKEDKDIVFLGDLPYESKKIRKIPNIYRFHDYVNSSDLIISRGGYGTISETLAYGIKHVILLEKNNPETIINAKLLKQANRAIIYELKDFFNNPNEIIKETLYNSKIDNSPMQYNGNIQAIDYISKMIS